MVSLVDKILNEFIVKIVCWDDDSCVEEICLLLINIIIEIYIVCIIYSDFNW